MRSSPIAVPDAVLADLRARLLATRWPAGLPGSGWRQGADLPWLREVCDYWARGYDWRHHEAELNRWPLFRAPVDGIDLHFAHLRGRGPRPVPLLLLHGWPGSIVEFQDVAGPLADPAAWGGDPADAFDVVIPSLPGFGFGGQPREPGWGANRITAALDRLMTQVLGYATYAVQGGDWGTILGRRLARNHPDHVRALHVNMAYAPPPPCTPVDATAAARGYDLTGYLHLQNTRADTLTVGLGDSPAGLATWILEKFASWSDGGGRPDGAIALDRLLTNLMFYWAPDSVASATRIYFETAAENDDIWATPAVRVPTGVAAFPKEPYLAPRAWVERLYDVQHWTDMPRGGHFAALEAPELLVADIHKFLRDRR